MDPQQWMGAVRMRAQTANKNFPINTILPIVGQKVINKIHQDIFESGMKYAQIKHFYKHKRSTTVLNKYVGGF